ncbi:hypothetical protein R69746_08585 [Paraburkholderia aspalathi]|nr:hypothetical protein R69746_08585 [Paraburkholderia aspalathi]
MICLLCFSARSSCGIINALLWSDSLVLVDELRPRLRLRERAMYVKVPNIFEYSSDSLTVRGAYRLRILQLMASVSAPCLPYSFGSSICDMP